MRQTLIVSTRGQITLPADIRKRFGIRSGEPVILEDRDGELVLKPATVLEIEMYTAEQIAQWDQDDALSAAERETILGNRPERKAARR